MCANIPGCVWLFESWCVEFVYIPGCVWNFMSGFLLNWLTPLKLTLKKNVDFFSDPSEIFKLLGMICCLRRRWWCKLICMAAEKGSFVRIGKHVLDIVLTFLRWIQRKFQILESFRRHYEGPLTEVLLMIKWMIEKLIQDNVVVLRTIRSFCQKIRLVLLRDEVKCCASAGSACEEIVKFLVQIWYSSTAMVDEWIASVLSACFRSPLQFNCKLVRYCNIWLSRWTRHRGFPRCIPSCGFLT